MQSGISDGKAFLGFPYLGELVWRAQLPSRDSPNASPHHLLSSLEGAPRRLQHPRQLRRAFGLLVTINSEQLARRRCFCCRDRPRRRLPSSRTCRPSSRRACTAQGRRSTSSSGASTRRRISRPCRTCPMPRPCGRRCLDFASTRLTLTRELSTEKRFRESHLRHGAPGA